MAALQSQAHVVTEAPGRYLGQLCKHFAHKLPVTLEEASGRIEFPFGTCGVSAGPGLLTLHATAPDAESLDRLQDVIARHLVRFAFREPLEVRWAPVDGEAASPQQS